MTMMTPNFEAEPLKAQLKATWMAGDFGQIAKHLESAAEAIITRLALTPGTRVLDVACGNGNEALPAARMGAAVTGVDIATNLLEQARKRAQCEGLKVKFDEGDAEQLPYAESSFDVVMSIFGAMFAPRPELVAAEFVRVCRPGGRIFMANWTPNGFAGQLFKVIGTYVPPPPDIPSPVEWGDEVIVRERLRDRVADLKLTRRMVSLKYPFPPAEVVELYRTYFGPTQRAFAALDDNGQTALRSDLERLWSEHNQATDDATHVEAEYLEVIATRS